MSASCIQCVRLSNEASSFRWEYVWCVSVVLSFVGLSAARANKVLNMQKYMIGVVVFGLVPVIYCLIHYASDVSAYMKLDEDTDLEDAENILVWMVSHSQYARAQDRNSSPLSF